MPDNFKQVVNLQANTNEKTAAPKPKPKAKLKPRPKAKTKPAVRRQSSKRSAQGRPAKLESRVEEIDQVYSNENFNDDVKEELSQIDRPRLRNKQSDFFQKLSMIFFIVIIALLAFYFFVDKKQASIIETEAVNSESLKGEWYSVQLSNNETYYGFIKDTSADPVILDKVYYNYNQVSGTDTPKEETSATNIRLVKRGKESHGPDGTMNIVRSQLMYMEVLGEESKILQAILKYEE